MACSSVSVSCLSRRHPRRLPADDAFPCTVHPLWPSIATCSSPTVLHLPVTGSHAELIARNISVAFHFLCLEPICNSLIPGLTRFSTLIHHLSSIPIHFFLGAVDSCPFACCSSAFHPRSHPPDCFQLSILPPSPPPSTPSPHLVSSKTPSWLPPSLADCPTPASSTRWFRPHLESPPCSYIYTTLLLHLLSS